MLRKPDPVKTLRGTRLACGLIVLGAVIAAAAAAGQTFRFRAAATRVIVDVLVLDDDGNPVPGLTPDDFELFEDGEPQRVASLDVVDWERYQLGEAVPAEAEPAPAAGPDLEASGADTGNVSPRRFVIVFNRRRADPVNLRRAKRGLEEFVSQQMVDGDETMILEFAHTVRVLQEFYSGKEQTLANVRRIIPGTYESPVGPEIDARDSFQMLYALAEALERVEGRKIVVFLSMGLQTFADPRQVVGEIAGDEVDEFPGRRALDETGTLQAAIRQLNHANATLYAVDLVGVYGNENRILTPSLNAFDVLGNPIPVESSDHPLARMEVAANIPAEGGTASLAVATGGTYFPNQTNFAVALNRIGIQNQLYYLLSFSPAKTELDGEYRQIAVRVRDRPDLRVIARPGYYARRRGDVVEAAARGDYDYAFPEDLNTYAYLLNPSPHGAFGVLAAALPESYLEEPAEVRLRVVGPGGAVLSEAAGPVDIRRFWVSTPAELPSGEHRLELVVERGGERVHAGSSALIIPTGFGETFSLSSVFPFVAEAHAPEAVGPPVRPVATFAQAEDARVAFFIFPGHEDPVSQVRVAYEIRNAIGEVAVEAERPGRFDLDPQRLEGTPIMLPLQTGPLRAGRYTAVVRVTDDRRNRSAVGELPFLIR
ncbi:MAG: VWA domain-containing protein [Acidobacteria bacterium]|nr:VWA domain-containing protein [Acidobacteriota bacterium]MYF14672.1 VWA domain-containing protein [Acidobacteriota bacterium]MYI96142.1 VWA domain-containing protein [Acidobacteriota bacterium]